MTGIVAQGRTLAQRLDRVQRAAETVPQRAEADTRSRRLSGLEDRIASLLTPAMRAVANATVGDDLDDDDDADDDDDVDDDGAGDVEDDDGEGDDNDADDGEDDDGEDDDNDSDDGKPEELRGDATVDDGDRAEPDDEDGEEPDTPEPASPAR